MNSLPQPLSHVSDDCSGAGIQLTIGVAGLGNDPQKKFDFETLEDAFLSQISSRTCYTNRRTFGDEENKDVKIALNERTLYSYCFPGVTTACVKFVFAIWCLCIGACIQLAIGIAGIACYYSSYGLQRFLFQTADIGGRELSVHLDSNLTSLFGVPLLFTRSQISTHAFASKSKGCFEHARVAMIHSEGYVHAPSQYSSGLYIWQSIVEAFPHCAYARVAMLYSEGYVCASRQSSAEFNKLGNQCFDTTLQQFLWSHLDPNVTSLFGVLLPACKIANLHPCLRIKVKDNFNEAAYPSCASLLLRS